MPSATSRQPARRLGSMVGGAAGVLLFAFLLGWYVANRLGFDRGTAVTTPVMPLVVVGLLYCLIFGYHWVTDEEHVQLRRNRPTLWLATGVALVVFLPAMASGVTNVVMGAGAQWIDGPSVEFPAQIIANDEVAGFRLRGGCVRRIQLTDFDSDRVIRLCAIHRFSPGDIGADLPVRSKVRVHSRRTVLGEVVERVERVRD